MCEKKARLNSEILSFFSGFEGGSVQDSYGAKRANTLLQQECTCSGSISCHCLLNFLLDTYGYPVWCPQDIQDLFSLPQQGFDVSLTQKQLQEEHGQQVVM
jgi:hypothetical protein